MSQEAVWLQSLQDLRDEMHAQHTRQSERLEMVRADVNAGFNKLRDEMRVQNGRVGKSEQLIAVLETSVVPLQRAVYGLMALILTSVVVGLLGLVLK